MIKSILSTLLICFVATLSQAQYISDVVQPDTTIAVDTTDISVQYARTITASDMRDHLSIIASDEYEGRETGTPGCEKAAKYISDYMENLGLQAANGDYGYYQPVGFTFSRWADTDIYINKKRFEHLKDYLQFPSKNRQNPALTADEVVYLGYGIDDPEYSDYKKNDVKGKVIMIYEGEPYNKDSISHITGTKEPSEWTTDMDKKLKVAYEKGVKLVLIIEDDIKGMLGENRRKLLGSEVQLGVKKEEDLETADHAYISTNIVKAIAGKKLKKMIKSRKRSNKKGKPCDVPMKTDFMINMTKKVRTLESQNVAAYIKGSEKPDEYVVISAHYDHLGKRGKEIYNGADDNGTGTTALLEMAQAMKLAETQGNGPKRSVVFLWMTGEEKGLLGSEYYSKSPLFPLEQTIVDVNVDMIGRVDEAHKDNPYYIYAIGSDRLSTDLHKINVETNQKYTQIIMDHTFNDEEDPNRFYFRSDHYNFAKNGIPSIFFFSGVHEDYHMTTDDVDRIMFDKMETVGRHIFHLTWELANRDKKIVVDGEVK